MKLDNQVVSLKLSQELKKAGYPQEGLWRWYYDNEENNRKYFIQHEMFDEDDQLICVAPTVAELGEALPIVQDMYIDHIKNAENEWIVALRKDSTRIVSFIDTEADARAKMWLYLKKEGLCYAIK